MPLPGASSVPISITLNNLGTSTIIDATLQEEECASAQLVVMVDGSGTLCGMQKLGDGSMSPGILGGMVEVARRVGKERIQGLDLFLKDEERRMQDDSYESVGFL